MKDNLIHFYEKNDAYEKFLCDKHQAWFHEKSYRKMAGKDYDTPTNCKMRIRRYKWYDINDDWEIESAS